MILFGVLILKEDSSLGTNERLPNPQTRGILSQIKIYLKR
jgi:hypothetical protein